MKKIPYISVFIYALIVLLSKYISDVFEISHECFAQSPMWSYGPFVLHCYFFDTLYKHLLFPSYLLLAATEVKLSYDIYFSIALFVNMLLLFFIVKQIIIFIFNRRLD